MPSVLSVVRGRYESPHVSVMIHRNIDRITSISALHCSFSDSSAKGVVSMVSMNMLMLASAL